ncbi:Vacuolar protein sorting-associated protein 26 [Babesia sp. Xinjiang]|uniref:Vacuolar protein sorting-associated protein 26 n=1 Tax=Babesia sp. Xinjiang TaxID=462227 RepID=UPI000A255A2C|nr:Vacuolar protein sorting-associated protein 26 [Babesia sp. Xinjiang]ORM39968.1 Vacuolar protein sorting-associated protein 26 [Babesia sp. Xinjiang]
MVPDYTCLSELRRLQQATNQRLEEFYTKGAFYELSRFAEQKISLLDELSSGYYVRRASAVLVDTNRRGTEQSWRSVRIAEETTVVQRLVKDVAFLRTLVFTKSVRVYQCDYSNNSDLDRLLLSYDLYNVLHLALLDAIIRSDGWEVACDVLLQLGVVLYLLRVDLSNVVRDLEGSASRNCTWFRAHLIKNILTRRGIYLNDIVPSNDDSAIVTSVVKMFREELQLETWSRVVMLWFRESSLHNVLETLPYLPLQLRSRIYRRAKSSILPHGAEDALLIKQGAIDIASPVRRTKNSRRRAGSADKRLAYNWCNLKYKRVFDYLLSTNSCYRLYALEAWLMLAQISVDIDHDLYSSLFFMVYMAARIIVSGSMYFNQTAKNPSERKSSFACGSSKEQVQDLNSMSFIMDYAWSHHRANQKTTCVMSDVENIWVRKTWNWMLVTLKDNSDLSGMARYLGSTRDQLEYMVMYDVDRLITYNAPDIDTRSLAPCSSRANKKPLAISLEIACNDLDWLNSKEDDGCVDSIHIEDVLVGDHSLEVTIDFSPLCHFLVCHNRFKKPNNISIGNYTYFAKPLVAKVPNFATQSSTSGYDRMVVLALVAFCISVDREYTVLHFRQSLDYLNYKDTLRKKGKLFLRQVLPWVPVRKSVETNRMLNFQKMIRTTFNSQARASYITATGDDNSIFRGLGRILACQYACNVRNPGIVTKHNKLRRISYQMRRARFKRRFMNSWRKKPSFSEITDRSQATLSMASGHPNKYYPRTVQFCSTCTIVCGQNKLSNGFSHTDPDYVNDKTSCADELDEHSATPLSEAISDTCCFCHLGRMISLIKWISHFIFTSGVWINTQNVPVEFPEGNIYMPATSCCASDIGEVSSEGKLRTETVNQCSRDSKILEYVNEVYTSDDEPEGIQQIVNGFTLLHELVESTMLVQLATFFHERQYDYLVLHLALLQVLQGRWNLSLSLLKQLQGVTSGYSTPFFYGNIEIYTDVMRLTHIESRFRSHLSAKLLIELVMEPQLAIEQLSEDTNVASGTGEVEGLLSTQNVLTQTKREYKHDDTTLVGGHDTSAISLLLMGAAYIKLGYLQVNPSSVPISEIGKHWIQVSDPVLGPLRVLECVDTHTETVGGDNFDHPPCSPDDVDTSYGGSRVSMAVQCILQSLSLDPLCYKAWVYLAHCAVLAHDYEFAYMCCSRSIECYDSCLAAWLTMAVVLSSRVRSCAPVNVTIGVWQEYLTRNTGHRKDGDSRCDTDIRAVPVPYDPVFPSLAGNELELSSHLGKSVGGDLSECLETLVTATRFGSVYAYAGALQLICRTADDTVDTFPWENARRPTYSSRIDIGELIMVLRASVDFGSQSGSVAIPEEWMKQGNKMCLIIKALVFRAVSRKLLISSIPFLRALCLMFSLDTVADSRSGSVTRCGASDSTYFEEEVYGWITCLEVLSQSSHALVADLLFPLLGCYLKAYRPGCSDGQGSAAASEKCYRGPFSKGYHCGDVERHFGDGSLMAADMRAEVAFLRLYVRSYNCGTDQLRDLLFDVRAASCRHNSRKLSLLEGRILAGLGRLEESAQVFEPLLRRGFTGTASTDYLMECRSMKVYSHVLKELGEVGQSEAVDAFAEQCYVTTPLLRQLHWVTSDPYYVHRIALVSPSSENCFKMFSMFFGQPCTLDVEITSEPTRPLVFVDPQQKTDKCPVFSDGEEISGTAFISLKPGKQFDHQGIKVELIGQSDTLYNKTGTYNFFTMSRDIEASGSVIESKRYNWKFPLVGIENESYWGVNIRLYYFVRITIVKAYGGNICKDAMFAVQKVGVPPQINNTIKMEVGIEDALHIEFEYNKSTYHLRDVILGKVYFLLVALTIKYMEVAIQRVETITLGRTIVNETQTLTTFEVMDGSPVKGECIPVRIYLNGLDLCPTYKNVQNKLTVKHYINLLIVDEDDKRYFKKQEIEFWRDRLG